MNRLQDDYDPYAVEEPSDEEPALSRWAAAPRGPPGLGRGRRARRAARLARRSPGVPGEAAQPLGSQDGQQCGKKGCSGISGAPGVSPQMEPCCLPLPSTVTEGKSALGFASVNGETSVEPTGEGGPRAIAASTHREDCQIETTEY